MFRRNLLVFSLILVCAALVFLIRSRVGRELEEVQGFPLDSGLIVLESYESSYQEGYRAFFEQQGIEIPVDPKVIYASFHMVEDESTSGSGYVDGYHKASESLSCPTCRRY